MVIAFSIFQVAIACPFALLRIPKLATPSSLRKFPQVACVYVRGAPVEMVNDG